MIFPADPAHLPRHPSQLYEAMVEGVVLFFVLRWFERRAERGGWYRSGLVAGMFLCGYGVFRFLLEFTRQPDSQLGTVLGPFSMGQLLCAGMVLGGGAVLWLRRRQAGESAREPTPDLAT
jgi:phosphatidylglycerol:prolipoprotein diacylglycerol transferase